MNASYFVLVAVVLTFATGFFVASIIWSIKWLLSPKEDRLIAVRSIHLLHIFSPHGFGASHNDNLSTDLVNKELFRYYHGKNVIQLDSVSIESVNNKELFQYNHGRN